LQIAERSPVLRKAGPLVPYFAVAAANVSNVALTRKTEIIEGVPVTDEHGKVRCYPPVICSGLISAFKLSVYVIDRQ
jgi:hypothetical protein